MSPPSPDVNVNGGMNNGMYSNIQGGRQMHYRISSKNIFSSKPINIAGLEPDLRHTEKLCIVSYNRQFSMKTNKTGVS